MQNGIKSDSRGIAADNHSFRADSFIGNSGSAFRPSAVRVPGISSEGHPHMQKNSKLDSRSITAKNHSHVDSEFISHAMVAAHSLTQERCSQGGDDR